MKLGFLKFRAKFADSRSLKKWLKVRNFLWIFVLTLGLLLGITSAAVRRGEVVEQDAAIETKAFALERIRDNIDTMIAEGERVAFYISADDNVKKMSGEDSFSIDTYKKNETLTQAIKTMNLFTSTMEYIDSIYVYFDANDFLLVSDIGTIREDKFSDMQWLRERSPLSKAQFKGFFRMAPKVNFNTPPYYFTILKEYKLPDGLTGVVAVNLNIKKLGDMLNKTESTDELRLYITDASDEIIYSMSMKDISRTVFDVLNIDMQQKTEGTTSYLQTEDGDNILFRVQSERYGLKAYLLGTLNAVFKRSMDLQNFFFTLLSAEIVLLFLLSFVLANKFYRPISSIMTILDAPENWVKKTGKKHTSLEDQLCDRIMFNVTQNKKLEQELTDRMISLRDVEQVALQSRFNSHFLYNTLDAIYWSCVSLCGGDNIASEMILLLSELLRASMNRPDQLITLREEVEWARKYIRINEIRKPGYCQVYWDISPELDEMLVCRMMLQPILENAWMHAFKGKSDQCEIHIVARKKNNELYISVIDNGNGLTPELLEQIRTTLANDKRPAVTHVGLYTAHKRIRLMFSGDYGVTVDSRENEGTTVTMVLPLISSMDNK